MAVEPECSETKQIEKQINKHNFFQFLFENFPSGSRIRLVKWGGEGYG